MKQFCVLVLWVDSHTLILYCEWLKLLESKRVIYGRLCLTSAVWTRQLLFYFKIKLVPYNNLPNGKVFLLK